MGRPGSGEPREGGQHNRAPRRVVPRGPRLVPSASDSAVQAEGTPRIPVSSYRPVPPQVDLPALEHEVLALWRDSKTFEKSLDRAADRPRWTFFEGPPTANGMPGTHHVE